MPDPERVAAVLLGDDPHAFDQMRSVDSVRVAVKVALTLMLIGCGDGTDRPDSDISPDPPTGTNEEDEPWPTLPDGPPDTSATALAALDVLRESWVWDEMGAPEDAKVLFHQVDDQIALITFRVDPEISFEGWLPNHVAADAPVYNIGLPRPNRPDCSFQYDGGEQRVARVYPYVIENGITFAAVVNLADGCVASIDFPEPPKPNADPQRGDFTVRYSNGYESEEPTGPGD